MKFHSFQIRPYGNSVYSQAVRGPGYFNLSELESVKGPMGLPIERDLFRTPRNPEETAPEMFNENSQLKLLKSSVDSRIFCRYNVVQNCILWEFGYAELVDDY
ncbi:MAG: DUF2958 domain-containing protein [Planctomycetota bacterium]|jgi:hypothetical protein